jgi:hypothetical protein
MAARTQVLVMVFLLPALMLAGPCGSPETAPPSRAA